jgi:hypothetical protein
MIHRLIVAVALLSATLLIATAHDTPVERSTGAARVPLPRPRPVVPKKTTPVAIATRSFTEFP